MSIFTGIKALFSTPKTIDKAVDIGAKVTDGIISGLDKLVFTEEEKSDVKQKASETLLEFWKVIASENTEQSKARRYLAVETFKVYFFFVLMGAAVYKFDSEFAKFLFDIAGTLTWLVSGIAAIYFGPHQFAKIWKKNDK